MGVVHCILENLTDNFTKKIAKIVMSFDKISPKPSAESEIPQNRGLIRTKHA